MSRYRREILYNHKDHAYSRPVSHISRAHWLQIMMRLTNCKKVFIYLLLFHIKIFVLLCLLSSFLLNTILFGKNSRLPKNVKNGTKNSHVSFTTIWFWQLPRQLSQLNPIQPGALHSVVTSFSSPSKRAVLQSFLDFYNLDMVEDYKAFIL